jgi:hypothetical protein
MTLEREIMKVNLAELGTFPECQFDDQSRQGQSDWNLYGHHLAAGS